MKRCGKEGVSDIVSNVLVLGLVVALFSGITYWVFVLEGPKRTLHVDLLGSLECETDVTPNVYWINITHKGGEPLHDRYIDIYISINNGKIVYTKNISDSYKPIGSEFTIGEVWVFRTTIVVNVVNFKVVDRNKNAVIWNNDMPISLPDFSPVICDRYTKPNPIIHGKQFKLYVRIIDPNGDLDPSSVYIEDPKDGVMRNMANPHADNVLFEYSPWYPADEIWDGKTLRIIAKDKKGNTATHKLVLSAVRYTQESTGVGYWGNLRFYGGQGFNIFEERDWIENEYRATPTRNFKIGEKVIVVVATKFLANTNNENRFSLYDISTRKTIPEEPTDTTTPSCTAAFIPYKYISGYYVYIYGFNTINLESNRYPLEIKLRDDWYPENNIFFAADQITVGTPLEYPNLIIYRDANLTQKYDIFSQNPFNSTDKLYVKILTQSTDTFDIRAGDVEIRDFFTGTELKGRPQSTNSSIFYGAVSGVESVVNGDESYYKMVIDLAKTNLDPWRGGNNTYVFRVIFKDTLPSPNGETYIFSGILSIEAPKYILDLASATQETTNNAWGYKAYVNYYDNDNTWTPETVIEKGNELMQNKYANIVKFGDLDNDNKKDVVAVVKYGSSMGETLIPYSYYIWWYDKGDNWIRRPIAEGLLNKPTDIAIANLDIDYDVEIIVGFENGTVAYYRNDGSWSYVCVDNTRETEVTSVECADVDGKNGIDIIVGRSNGTMTVYRNDGFGNFASGGNTTYYTATDESLTIGEYYDTNRYPETQVENGVCEGIKESVVTESVVDVYTYVTSNTPTFGTVKNFSYAQADNDDKWATIVEDSIVVFPENRTFDPGLQPWTSKTTRALTQRWDNTTGNPSPSVYAKVTGSNKDGTGTWETTFIYTRGIPSRATISFDRYEKYQGGGLVNQFTILVIKPSGELVPIYPTTTISGTPSWVRVINYSVATGIFEQAGTYKLQIYSELSTNPGAGNDVSIYYDNVELSLTSPYRYDVEFTTSDVPQAENYYLQIRYKGDTEPCELWVYNGSTSSWSQKDTLSSDKWTIVTYKLSVGEYNNGIVRVRYVDNYQIGDSEENMIHIDYHRVYSYTPGATYSALQHMWKIDNVVGSTGSTFEFRLVAKQNGSTENDKFLFKYQIDTSSGKWKDFTIPLIVDTSHTELTTYSRQFQDIDAIVLQTGNHIVYIQVIDNDRTDGNITKDIIFVDYMSVVVTTPSGSIGVDIPTGDFGGIPIRTLTLGDVDLDGDIDIIACGGGKICESLDDGNGDFSTPVQINTGESYTGIVSVGLGYFMNDDKLLDIAVGVGSNVYIYRNTGKSPFYPPIASTIINVGAQICGEQSENCMDVGDVDGDGDTDIVLAVSDGVNRGQVRLITNELTQWIVKTVHDVAKPVYSVALG